MCGLVGMVGFLEPHKHKAVMRDLLFLDTLRGRDSTGLSVVKRDRSVLTRKMTCPGYEFIEYPVVDKAMTYADQLWMGHNRFKTTGEVSRANAHPFEVLDQDGDVLLVGAHNGTLNNKWDIERALGGDKYDTDSEALFNLLVEKPDYKEAIAMLRGAWSLVWWDATNNTLNFCRNDQRPMTYAWTKDHKVLIYASEPWMIINAARRNGVELDKNENGLSCYSTTIDNLYTLHVPQERDRALPDIIKEGGYSGAPDKKFRQSYPGEGGWERWKEWWDNDPNDPNTESEGAKKASEGKKETAPASKTDEPKQTVTLGYPPFRGFKGEELDLKAFRAIQAKGCGWCGDKLPKDKPFAFLTEDTMICINCLHDRHPKGDCVRPGELQTFVNGLQEIDEDEDFLDDDLPFDLGPPQANSPEGRKLIAAAVAKAVD